MPSTLETGPSLLLNWHEPEESSRHVAAAIGTLVFHVLALAVAVLVARYEPVRAFEDREIPPARHVTLIAPPMTRLTQRDPNKGKVAKEVKLENLLPKPEIVARTPQPAVAAQQRTFQAPPANPLPPSPKPATLAPPEPPRVANAVTPPAQGLPANVGPVAPPPQIQPVEKPKLAFQTPGQGGSAPVPGGFKVPIPKTTVDEAIKSIARGGGGQGGIVVGDVDQVPTTPDGLRRPNSARTQSSLELLSDPLGVDFKPYLIRILATVRRNWFAVWPESAHLGNHGIVALKFSISREGKVPKLIISMPSGSEALDRAAIAGISASVPFPPLPVEFKGQQIVLQFSFRYN